MSAFTYVRGFTALHHGVDLSASSGTPIHAVAGGTVIYARDERTDTAAPWYSRGGGNVVHVDVGGGQIYQYAHQSAIAVRVGQSITAGSLIGAVGMTGNATGPHLHFAIFVPHLNAFVDPLAYMTLAQLIAAVSSGSGGSLATYGPDQVAATVALLTSLGISTDPTHVITSSEAGKIAAAPKPGYGLVAGSEPWGAAVTALTGLTVAALEDSTGLTAGPSDPITAAGALVAGALGAATTALSGALTSGLWLAALLVLIILGLYLTLGGGSETVAGDVGRLAA